MSQAAVSNPPSSRPLNISLEVFPPRSMEGGFQLWDTMNHLAPFVSDFVSVTYGAGGTTREVSFDTVKTLHQHIGVRTAAHLTCVGTSKAETLAIAQSYADIGVTDIVALRGDPPAGSTGFVPHPEGFQNVLGLISELSAMGQFNVRVAAYPEQHPEAADSLADVRWLKKKFESGASSALTQFFFDVESFLRFRDLCAKEGITSLIVPGILPITNWQGAKRFAQRCGAYVPPRLDAAFTIAERDGRAADYALVHCTQLCDTLIQEGVEDLHFYTLNRPELTQAVLTALGVKPSASSSKGKTPLQRVA